jgi:hypothetical protein
MCDAAQDFRVQTWNQHFRIDFFFMLPQRSWHVKTGEFMKASFGGISQKKCLLFIKM